MKKMTGWLAIVALLIVAGAGIYFWQQGVELEPRPQPQVETPAPPPPPKAEEPTHYPLPQTEDTQAGPVPLPPLQDSDPALRDALSNLFGQAALKKFFKPSDIVRHIVVTIDNLPRKTVATRLLPTRPVDGKFLAAGRGDKLTIAPENAARYTPYVRLAEMVDAKKLVAVYVKLYPLFQNAYQDLGYPNGYFNDRLVAVIDHLLEAPEVEGPIALTQPHVLYEFADPDLQASSAGHKIMLRMGSENEERLKVKLREIRRELTSGVVPHS